MAHLQSTSTTGAVAALLVATAPDAAPVAADLLWRAVAGRPLVSWPLGALTQLDDLGYCALITPLERYDDGVNVIQNDTRKAPSRMKAVIPTARHTWLRALASAEDIPMSFDWLIVIDATLPLVTTESLGAGLRAAEQTGVAIAAEAVKETLKRVDGAAVAETLPRDALRRLLSPVIFHSSLLESALERCRSGNTRSDDLVTIAQAAGVPMTTFDAGYPAVRVTSEDDLAIVETLLRQRESEASPS